MSLNHRHAIKFALLLLLLSGCASTEKETPVLLDSQPPLVAGNIQAVQDALQLQGYRYRYGGKSPIEGFDCSGLVVYVYDRQGLKLPRTTQMLARQLPAVPLDQRQPGDLLFFHTEKPYSHVGIYVGDDNFVHAPSTRTGKVMLSSLQQPYWHKRFIGVRRPIVFEALSLNQYASGCPLN
jgi:cell wall-associated NlpC family hydrolase